MFRRYLTRVQHSLQLWYVQPENGHNESEEDCREEGEVLGSRVEGGRVREDGEAAGADGHQVEPLPI